MRIDYEYKAQVLESGLPKLQKKVSKVLFYNSPCGKLTVEKALQIDKEQRANNTKAWHESENINHASRQRAKRLQTRILKMLAMDNCLFLTLTFKDDVLANTCRDTRRQYVRKYLKQYNVPYTANIDFGGKKGREHYHAIIQCDNINYRLWHQFGAVKGKKIITSVESAARLSKYVTKLTNHAIKKTTQQNYVMYSRA